MRPIRLKKKCNNCGVCVDVCPVDVFKMRNKKVVTVKPKECIYCEVCKKECPQNAIKFKKN